MIYLLFPISIHAPTRGATQLPVSDGQGFADFNPRSHEGSDAEHLSDSCRSQNFNPRSREGSDRNCGSRRGRLNYNFNPRSREGSDYSLGNTHALHVRFQSTLPRGERRYSAVLRVCCSLISIHAPARGAPVIPGRLLAHVVGISIHAPARGATKQIGL